MDQTNRTLITKDVAEAVADGMERAAGEIVEDIKQRISTAYPPASKAGEAPHRRTGNLLARTDQLVSTELSGREITLTLSNTAAYAAFLRDGTPRMAKRDFFQETDLDLYLPKVIDAVVEEITAQFTK